jgi:site-specific DNA recombinase
MKIAAIYARVSSDKQREDNTIASQTAALIAFAESQGYGVSEALIFEDDGYSGTSLVRPGLERIRDLAAEGQLDAVLVYAPDRLSRKYAYQVLLVEELARHGVETVFVKAPAMATPEDQLLLQFQGMIAEYERAQILERSRRGKRYRARQGQVSVLSGAPYGYRYVRKTDEAAAYYEITEAEADVVRRVYDRYTVSHMSIGAITRWLNEQGVPTRKGCGRWERSSVWAMLRNPAYKGTACFGKTRIAPRQRITRPLRLRGGLATRNSASHERPREEWIEIPVPAIVSDDTFALAQERLERNKVHAPRRTITPSVVQGLVSCRKCGYALSRTSTRSSARTIHYYRCLGSDAWRHRGGPVCGNRPVRQDLLDQVVWAEIIRLLETPSLIQEELDRRLAAARTSDPTQRRQKALERDLARLRKSMDRLLTAYQEELISLDELRRRIPALRQRERATHAELQSIIDQTSDRATYLRLAETLAGFLTRLRSSAETLDVHERQRIVRLLVKEVLVGDDTIIIRHSIPIPTTPSTDGHSPPTPTGGTSTSQCYLLRSGRAVATAGQCPARRSGQGTGTSRSLFRALRRRCERLCPQPEGGRTGDDAASAALRQAALDGQRDQERRRRRVRSQIPGLRLLGGSGRGGQTQSGRQADGDVQAAHPATDPPFRWAQYARSGGAAAVLCLGVEGLLSAGADTKGLARPGSVDPPPAPCHPTQAVETWQDHVPGTAGAGGKARGGAPGRGK